MKKHILTGFGFGPIQSGLFVAEAFKSGNFKRIVIAEIDQRLVDAVRANNGTYYINIAGVGGIETVEVKGIEIYNPTVEKDRLQIIDALAHSTEIVTSLPSVKFYDAGENSVASLISAGLKTSKAEATIVYTAENNNHAAEILEEVVQKKLGKIPANVQFLNTVIGKMSQVVTDKDEILQKNIKTISPGIDRAFLVEEFNRILVTKCNIKNYTPGIEVFLEKEDLLAFEEVKLFGHNAIHALLGYLGAYKGYKKMSELANDKPIMQIARDAFLKESGAALVKKYSHLKDELFTEAGYKKYAEDLLVRIVNPYLDDTTERAARDPQRKLGPTDRIFGTMQLALEYRVKPNNMAKGAAAGLIYLLKANQSNVNQQILSQKLKEIFTECTGEHNAELIELTEKAFDNL
jgi:mannitol-1-phosphate 5-dehydrogenase